ncbi:MAG TPA: hypothetical protein VKH63_22195 [Candidatus Acidoferrum sp.]|nr:hypothetical protein [Candidatus Acidoferrum sp.]
MTVSPNKVLLEATELPLLTPSCRNELARFSNTFLSPWHKSSQSPYLFDDRSPEFSTAGPARKLSVVADAGVVGAAVAGVGVSGAAFATVGCGIAAGAEAARGCGASDFADADSSKALDGGLGFRARSTDEFNQNEILAVPSACRTVCRCNGHCPR